VHFNLHRGVGPGDKADDTGLVIWECDGHPAADLLREAPRVGAVGLGAARGGGGGGGGEPAAAAAAAGSYVGLRSISDNVHQAFAYSRADYTMVGWSKLSSFDPWIQRRLVSNS
jgi:hypothetical protein